ncbi:MAG: sugar phosphate isomerase/epimerase [Candidatus Pacearchaeota archaeon]
MAYTNYESFYNGSYSALSPDFGEYFSGYRMSAAQLGFPGSPSTANQLGETVNALKQGVKAFEVSLLGIQGDPDQTIPKQHFKEMRALMKLSGVKPSVHGPIVDAAGFGERGWGGEITRADNERRMFDALEKAYELDPTGKIPVVLHSTNGIPGNEYLPGENGKIETNKVHIINLETNQLVPIETEYKYRPEQPKSLKGKGKFYSIDSQIRSANQGEWENKLTDLATFNKHADEVIGAAPVVLKEYRNAIIDRETHKVYEFDFERNKKGQELPSLESDPGKLEYAEKIKDADIFLENVQLNFAGAFHKAYKYGSDEQKKRLEKLSNDYSKGIRSLSFGEGRYSPVWLPIEKRKILDKAITELQDITETKYIENSKGGIEEDPNYGAPKLFQKVEDFAIKKAIETFGNLAIKSYDKFKDKAPIIAVENMYQGMAFSRAEDLKKIIEDSRDRFENYLIEKGMKKDKAEKLAEEKIGATWDVGHLNVMKKKGFTDNDIIEETKKIKDYVKHIHLTDNFGYSDSHLPPGMGNVPIKKILEELEKNGRFDEMRKIVEAGNFVQHFKKSPHPLTLSTFGSPIYGMANAPYWNQGMDMVGGYFGGYGTINPQQHHSLYGAGFTSMPVELGGAMPGAQGQSRFGGTPMA